jgi:uncharacterized protein YbjT (DUF2867 family)
MSKVLVTGGSGYLVTRLITALLRDGREVRATVRSLDSETDVRTAVSGSVRTTVAWRWQISPARGPGPGSLTKPPKVRRRGSAP